MTCADRLEEDRNFSPQLPKPPLNIRIPLPRKNLATRNDPHDNGQHVAPGRPS